MTEARLRFAPSPTGVLHIGSGRTALYNWLVARKAGGKFILRIEDTDIERSTQESVDAILEAMEWLGMDWDEGPGKEGECGPYFQTQRFDIYKKHLDKLLEEGKAYRCYATKEELEEMRAKAKAEKGDFHYDRRWRDKGPEDWPEGQPYVIRFKAPLDGEVVVDDEIIGKVVFPIDKHIDDFVIYRSDGTPTYNFTVVVDDVTMGVTEVIRGNDHLSNTPKQILIYEALGYPVPRFAHMPLTHGEDGKKLSKRHGPTSVVAYRDMGYLPEALVNFLVRLGWAYGDEEIFSKEELIQKFSVQGVGKSPGIFKQDKLDWFNQQYIQKMSNEELAERVMPYCEKLDYKPEKDERLSGIIEQYKPRSKTLVEMADGMKFFYSDDFEYDQKADNKFLTEKHLPILNIVVKGLESLSELNHDSLSPIFQKAMEEMELKLGKVAQPVRVALCGRTFSPGIFDTIELLGKEESLKRLNKAIEHIKAKG